MGLRWLMGILIVDALFWNDALGAELRVRRQAPPGQGEAPKLYQPPLLQNAPAVPVASSATIQNSYQPPISLIRSNEYQSPINAPHSSYSVHHQPAQPSNVQSYQGHQQPNGGQGYPGHLQPYALPNQPLPPSYSVHQQPQLGAQQSYSVYQQPQVNQQNSPYAQPQSNLATSYSVHQQPAPSQPNQRQPFSIFSDSSGVQGLPQSTAERTYSTHSKVVGSSHVPAQAIHKAPASEIQSDKGSLAKDKDNKNDEYVVYYYYYYDNDTAANANNNLSLNFDDIPSLEAYDNEKNGKEPEKSASARTLAANVNSLTPLVSEPKRENIPTSESSSSQPRSVAGGDRDAYIRSDKHNNPLSDTVVQPLKPVSNVFRYGSNEVPRFPVLPNFIVSEAPTTTKSGEIVTPDTLTSDSPTTLPTQVSSRVPEINRNDDPENDDLNNVLDHSSDLKSDDDRDEEAQTTTTTTTEPPTTTEIPTTTTTTERSRRRPSIGGGRRRFNQGPAFSANRNGRQNATRGTTSSSSSTSTTTTTTSSTPTRGSFRGSNRLRPRPPVASNRPRTNSRTTEVNEDKTEKSESKSESETTTSSTTASRSRFTSAAPRRFQSSRSRSQSVSSASTSSTTRAPTPPRSRPTSRPRPNPIVRNRPPRPGFLRPRPGSEPEEAETTTAEPVATEEETSPSGAEEEPSSTDNNEDNGTEEELETSEEETEEPTTTEANRFSALFRPRNRGAGNRPRPVIGNRPSRS